MRRLIILFGAAILLAVVAVAPADGQSNKIKLPKPVGIHSVGTMTYEWADQQRTFSYSSHDQDQRKIVVQIWYPSTNDLKAQQASYSPLSNEFDQVVCNSQLRPGFAKGLSKCPLILVCPGRGVKHCAYTVIAESLSSRGYVVAAIGMPGIGNVSFSDGYQARPDPRFQPSRGLMSGPYEKVDEFFETPTEIGRQDLDLAVRRLRKLNEGDPSNRFINKLDLSNIGIFGHSLGGRVGGAFAAANTSVKAYISMEGIAPRRARFEGLLHMPVAMMCSSGTLPYAKQNYQTLIDGRTEQVFMIELQKFGHNSVTDLPLIDPDRFNYEIEPKLGLLTSVKVIERFFDTHLKRGNSFGESLKGLDNVIVTEFTKKNK